VVELLEQGPAATDVYPSLVNLLVEDESLDAVIAAQVLFAKPRPATEAPTLAVALAMPTKARVPAAWNLSQIGPAAGARAGPALLAAAKAADKHDRNFVVLALATTAPPPDEVVPALLTIMEDRGSTDSAQTNYKYPRAMAGVALGMLGSQARQAIVALTHVLSEQNSWEYHRAAACFALGRIGAQQAQPALKQALQDSSPVVRRYAALALQMLQKPLAADAGDVPNLMHDFTTSPCRINPKLVAGLESLGEYAGTVGEARKPGSNRAVPPVHESIALALGYLGSLATAPTSEEIAQQERQGRVSP
jgi:HEAT repeat protein